MLVANSLVAGAVGRLASKPETTPNGESESSERPSLVLPLAFAAVGTVAAAVGVAMLRSLPSGDIESIAQGIFGLGMTGVGGLFALGGAGTAGYRLLQG